MTLADLLTRLDAAGVRLDVRLVVDAPQDTLTPDIVGAMKANKPLILARLVAAALDGDRDDWGSFRHEVDGLQAGGVSRADAIRHAYARRFGTDPGEIDPAPLAWLWEDRQ